MRSQWNQDKNQQSTSVVSTQRHYSTSIDQKSLKPEFQLRDYSSVNTQLTGGVVFRQGFALQEHQGLSTIPAVPMQIANPISVGYVVVTKEEVEAPWREECYYLLSVIEDLKQQKGDSEALQRLTMENQELLEKLRKRDLDYAKLNQEYTTSQSIIQKLRNDLQQKDRDYDELYLKYQSIKSECADHEDELQHLRQRVTELEEMSSEMTETTITHLNSEVNVWRDRFVEANHKFNETQEKLIMCEAELEAIRKESSSLKREMTVTRTIKTQSSSQAMTRGSQQLQ